MLNSRAFKETLSKGGYTINILNFFHKISRKNTKYFGVFFYFESILQLRKTRKLILSGFLVKLKLKQYCIR